MSMQKLKRKSPYKALLTGMFVSVGVLALMSTGASAMRGGDRDSYCHGKMGGMKMGRKHGKQRMEERFKAADTDANGSISKAEFDAHRSARFSEKDQDSDGFISGSELDGLVKLKVGKRADRMMKKFDKNADGTVTKEELVAGLSEKMSPRIKRRMGRRLKRMDDNWDGKVSKEEFDNRAKRRFARKDKNDDGQLTLDEMRKGSSHHGRKRHHRRRHEGGRSRGSY